MHAVLYRKYMKDATYGILRMYYDDGEVGKEYPLMEVKTLELPWEDNERSISCIPEGQYYCTPRWSERHKDHFHILEVKDRDLILFHLGNYTRDIEGCILVGMGFSDIDRDGIVDVHNSRSAMNQLLRHGGYWRGKGFELEIKENGREVSKYLP